MNSLFLSSGIVARRDYVTGLDDLTGDTELSGDLTSQFKRRLDF